VRRHRSLIVLRGTPEQTRVAALDRVGALEDTDVLWVSEDASTRYVDVSTRGARGQLGQSFVAVVLDCHDRLDADVLGQCQGFVWGGGALVLRLPEQGDHRPDTRLAVFPFELEDVGTGFATRFESRLGRLTDATLADRIHASSPKRPGGTEEQADVVRQLSTRFSSSAPTLSVLLSDRGRGKSSALGLALLRAEAGDLKRVAVTASSETAVAEVLRFAPDAFSFVPLAALLDSSESFDLIVVDEAAQVPVPTLQALVRAHPESHLAFASTVRGYEGTGRGFVLRFLNWLKSDPRPLVELKLKTPIRWDPGDPLERFVFDALALDAEPDRPSEGPPSAAEIERGHLAEREELLRGVFGLLVHAHYRTTPADLSRALDAPNLRLHALTANGSVLAATLVALEGALPAATCEDIYRGRGRIRGHALPDTLISHCGRLDAGPLKMVRSVRIATHPDRRRERLASALVEHVHASYAPDLFGTLFGATAELLRFRRSLGYVLVRVGASRGARTGEPAAVMVRPISAAAQSLVEELRAALARDLPLQLELMRREVPMHDALVSALHADLPAPAELTAEVQREAVQAYAFGPRPFESFALAIRTWVSDRTAVLSGLDETERRLVESRILRGETWAQVARAAQMPSVPAAMRATRRAMRALSEASAELG